MNKQPGLLDILHSARRPAAALVAACRALKTYRQSRGSGIEETADVARYSIITALLVAVVSCGSSPSSPSGGAAQTVYYVSPAGHDQDAGTITAPFQTISAGVKRLRPGDTLYLRGGTYTGVTNTVDSKISTVPSGTSGSRITIAEYPGETVILQPPPGRSAISLQTGSPAYLTFKSFTIDMANNSGHGAADGIFASGANSIWCDGLEVMNGAAFGVHHGTTPDFRFINGSVHNVGMPGSSPTEGHGLYVTSSSGLYENNDVYDNQGYGFHIYNNAGSHADPSRNIVRGNRIHGNGRHGGTAYGVMVAWGDANEIASNQIFDNPGGIMIYTDSTNTNVHDNNIYNNRPLEGIMVQYSSGTKLANNTATANGSDVVDLGSQTTFRQNSFQAPVKPGVR